MVASNSMLW